MKRRPWITGSAAVITLTLAACGGGGGGGALSEDDFVDQLDDICRDTTRAIDDLDSSDSSYVEDIIEIMEGTLDDLNALKAPDDLQDDFDDFMHLVQELANIGTTSFALPLDRARERVHDRERPVRRILESAHTKEACLDTRWVQRKR